MKQIKRKVMLSGLVVLFYKGSRITVVGELYRDRKACASFLWSVRAKNKQIRGVE